jgi:hypothetical protein
MGAMQNRRDNMLMLFRFIISSGLADFWADRNSKLTIGAFSFHFKFLSRSPVLPQRAPSFRRYSIAAPNELMQYRASPEPSLPIPLQSTVPFWPRLGQNKDHRSFGGDRARKPAGGDAEVGVCAIRTVGLRSRRPIPVDVRLVEASGSCSHAACGAQ